MCTSPTVVKIRMYSTVTIVPLDLELAAGDAGQTPTTTVPFISTKVNRSCTLFTLNSCLMQSQVTCWVGG